MGVVMTCRCPRCTKRIRLRTADKPYEEDQRINAVFYRHNNHAGELCGASGSYPSQHDLNGWGGLLVTKNGKVIIKDGKYVVPDNFQTARRAICGR